MSDPIEQLRKDLDTVSKALNAEPDCRVWQSTTGFVTGIFYEDTIMPTRLKMLVERCNRAAKVLLIAETEGVDAALLWKLAN